MTKKILAGLCLFPFIAVFSQTGIGTGAPEGALDITSPNNEWGLVLPQVAQAENTKNPTGKSVKKGTIIYDLKENCVKYFNGSEWSGCMLAPISIKLECSSAVLNQDIIANFPIIAAGTTVSVPYSNQGEVFSYGDITLSSTNVNGLKAVLSSGSIKKGSGNLVFSISGTPSVSGIAKFPLSIGGVQCEFAITIKNYTDIIVPALVNVICDQNNQLTYATLKGNQIVNGKDVIVNFSGTEISTSTAPATTCNAVTSSGIRFSARNIPSALIITFSRPVTNVGMAFTGANGGELLTFSTNNNQPIQLKSSSSCQNNIQITGNKISFTGTLAGGNITVGGVWFTELTIQHNGFTGGLDSNFCLSSSSAL